ncbi:protein FAM169B isoform X2 [Mus musculus]|uniref:protein FAM169B isoform X2 n=1 Tax=Mus musculus TaxID=10090 RepID=UPI0003D70615|nr:protein FAM169B isoform X2 [Mus musculus]|eukprot:XP_006541038.1 PREDICTED: protein FAM169B isoform X3 [Mus musculus]
MEAEAVRGVTEAYPVDILEDDAEGYQAAAEAYYEMLREGAQTSAEVISLSTGEQVRLETSSLCFCTIYRDEPQHKILGLVNPQDTKTGSLCGDGTGTCYLLPVLDTVFVRRKNRCQGLGTAMLRDFCDTFQGDEALGISCPISPAMYRVLRQFLLTCPGERGRLWEVEPPGAWGQQRVNIWLKVYLQERRLQDGSTVHPKCSEEDTDTPGQASQEDGPTQFNHGESHKEWAVGEPERTQNGRRCAQVCEEARQV